MKKAFSILFSVLLMTTIARAQDTSIAAKAVNELGVDLLKSLSTPSENLCLSPYSIQSALAMTFAGAQGPTRDEMAGALHYEKSDATLHQSFEALEGNLRAAVLKSEKEVEQFKKYGSDGGEAIVLRVANRLFGKEGYGFRDSYLNLVRTFYRAPLEPIDFAKSEQARERINGWIEEQTEKRIKDIIAPGGITPALRLVLVNAIYLKAPWAEDFNESLTKPQPFHASGASGATKAEVPTMFRHDHFGWGQFDGYQMVSIPYRGNDLHFLILLPDSIDGLLAIQKSLTAHQLAAGSSLHPEDIELYLPKFKITPPTVDLVGALSQLGMKGAFDRPPGSANFDGIAPRTSEEYLFISQILHKTFFALDEKGTEAAAATVVMALAGSAFNPDPPKPRIVRVDRPFIYAVQDRKSGACLFLGTVVDPR
jgi:serpin B